MYRVPNKELILASRSAMRCRLMHGAGLGFRGCAAGIDEAALREAGRAEGASGVDMATMLAEMKARKVSALYPDALVVGCDQMLVAESSDGGEAWFSKPKTRSDAAATLRVLSGRRHELVTAAVVYGGERRLWHHASRPMVSLRRLSEADIADYLDALGDEALATPGAYMVEGLGVQIISKIEGCSYAVLGMPLLEFLDFLRGHGLRRYNEGDGEKTTLEHGAGGGF